MSQADPKGHGGGIDYRWVMETTFVLTVVVGAPLVGLSAVLLELPTWEARVAFAVPVAAGLWILMAALVYLYARRVGAAT